MSSKQIGFGLQDASARTKLAMLLCIAFQSVLDAAYATFRIGINIDIDNLTAQAGSMAPSIKVVLINKF